HIGLPTSNATGKVLLPNSSVPVPLVRERERERESTRNQPSALALLYACNVSVKSGIDRCAVSSATDSNLVASPLAATVQQGPKSRENKSRTDIESKGACLEQID